MDIWGYLRLCDLEGRKDRLGAGKRLKIQHKLILSIQEGLWGLRSSKVSQKFEFAAKNKFTSIHQDTTSACRAHKNAYTQDSIRFLHLTFITQFQLGN